MAWISKNAYLTKSEMQNNALMVYAYCINKGWTLNAIAGMLGNMQVESNINPGIWQGLNEYGKGYGLVQWDPYTNYTSWADANGYSWTDGDAQLKWIDERSASTGQWIINDSYNTSWADFKTSNRTPEELAYIFLVNFERASVEVVATRKAYARNWYTFLNGNSYSGAIEKAISWAIGIAEDNAHGYDQINRWGPNYDCSSLLITAFQNAGVPVKTNGATYTGDMADGFIKSGFLSIPFTSGMELVRGDVLLANGHTEMYIGNNQNVGAHINENGETTGGTTGDQTGNEISVTNYYNGNWHTVLRLPGGSGPIFTTPKRKGFKFVLFNHRRKLTNAKRRIY